MFLSPFGRSKSKIQYAARPSFEEVTLDDFSGGLDLSENELKLKTNFSIVEKNVHRDVDGTKSIRWGTKYKYNVSDTVSGDVLDMAYYQNKILTIMNSGQIATVDDNGVKTAIWNAAIAALLPGSPSGWSAGLTQANWSEFKNELVVCNGVDKPILVGKTHTITYLQDLPTGSNVNVPIAKYVTTVGNYCVMAGVAATPDVVYISAAGTSGTWPGDPAPNDALSINIASYTAEQGGDIRGLSSFRNYLIIHFVSSSLVMVLGEYSGTVHKPRVLDTIPEHGVISHRTITVLENDIVYADEFGVHKAKRNAFGTAVDSEKTSLRIQKDFISAVDNALANRLKSFSVYNKTENRIMFFIYDGTQYTGYMMTFNEGLKQIAWSKFDGWNFVSAVQTAKGRIFFSKGSKLFQYGNNIYTDEDFTADFINEDDGDWMTATPYVVGDRRRYTDGNVYQAIVAHTSGIFADDLFLNKWELYAGDPIDADWELPWTSANARMRKKRIGYIGIDTVGRATFTFQIYVDNIRTDENGDDDPAISMDFVAGSSPGYGGGDQPYGGGRRAADERMWGFPCEFKIAKLRVKTSTRDRLQVVAISILLTKGTYKR